MQDNFTLINKSKKRTQLFEITIRLKIHINL